MLIPDAATQAISRKVTRRIAAQIHAAGGILGFDEFMQTALYAPGLGYYRRADLGKVRWGADFVTAPLLGNLAARCLAVQCAEALEKLGGGDMLEFAPGNGQLAADILQAMDAIGQPPRRYYMVDLGGAARAQQRRRLTAQCGKLAERVVWRTQPPRNFTGVMFANELLDAIPTQRFRYGADGCAREYGVTLRDDKFAWAEGKPLANDLQHRLAEYELPPGYVSEINPRAEAFMRAVGAGCERSVLLLLDYGFPRAEFYHPQRAAGTLMCHYQQYAHPDPFFVPGAQDISAHVDFTAIADAARAGGLRMLGYTSQAAFLLSLGILDSLAAQMADYERAKDAPRVLQLSRQAQQLMQPHEMGELFKVIAFGKNFPQSLRGFAKHDRRAALQSA